MMKHLLFLCYFLLVVLSVHAQNDSYLSPIALDISNSQDFLVTVDNTLVVTTSDATTSFPPGIVLPNNENFNTIFYYIATQQKTYNLSLSTCNEDDPEFDTILYIFTYNETRNSYYLLNWNDDGNCHGYGSTLSSVIFDGLSVFIAAGCYQGESSGSFDMRVVIDYENIDFISAIRELHVDLEQSHSFLQMAANTVADVKNFLEPSISNSINEITTLLVDNTDSINQLTNQYNTLLQTEANQFIENLLQKNSRSSIPRIYQSPSIFNGKLDDVKSYVDSVYANFENSISDGISSLAQCNNGDQACARFFSKIKPSYVKYNSLYTSNYASKHYRDAFFNLQTLYNQMFPLSSEDQE